MRAIRIWLLAVAMVLALVSPACGSKTEEGGEVFVPTTSPAGPTGTPTTSAKTTTSTATTAPPTTVTTEAPTSAVKPALTLMIDGLGPVMFGDDRARVVEVLSQAYGTPVPVEDCPDYEALQWGGLTAIFYQGRFLAWVSAGDNLPPLTTDRAIGYGSTMAEVRAAYPELLIEPSTMGDGSYSYISFGGEQGDSPYKWWGEFSGNAESDTLVVLQAWDQNGSPNCGRS